jgi:hypothetical protein
MLQQLKSNDQWRKKEKNHNQMLFNNIHLILSGSLAKDIPLDLSLLLVIG